MPKVGRNDPCPCESGKKYKRCCLPRNEVVEPPVDEQTASRSSPRFKQHETFLRHAVAIEALIEGSGMRIRDSAKAAFGDLLDVRLISLAALGWCMTSRSGTPGKTSPTISQRLVLLVTFLQGQSFVERCIAEGYYIRAAALLKQDVETLARIEECKKGVAQEGRTPNIKHIPNMGRQYAHLNEAAHVAVSDVIENLLYRLHEGEVRGVSAIPTFRTEAAVGLYELHCFMCWRMAAEALLLHWEMYGDDEEQKYAFAQLFVASEILERHEVLEAPRVNPDAPRTE